MLDYKNPVLPPEKRARDLLGRMTLEEKIGQLNEIPLSRHEIASIEPEIRAGRVGSLIYATSALAGDEDQFCGSLEDRQRCQRIAVEETRLGIPMINGSNIVHGHRTAGPIPLGQAAAFDEGLTEAFAAMSAKEAVTDGIHWTYAPMVDIARDPRWGRIAEGFGEDPYLAGRMGAACVRGFQGDDPAQPDRIAACCKHYVGYGAAEGGRDYESVEISEHTLRNIYLPPFKSCVDAGALTVMSAFHENDGTPVTASHHLLTEILKEEFGFRGFIISDWDAVAQLIHQRVAADRKDAARLAVNAGVDMDMLSTCYVKNLAQLVEEGKVSEKTIDEAVYRILYVKFRLGLFEHPYAVEGDYDKVVLHPDHRALARTFAARSIVLLKQAEELLPLTAQRIYAMGPMLREQESLLGTWATESLPEDVVSIARGLKNALGSRVQIENTALLDQSLEQARSADVVIVALGESSHSSGEAKSLGCIELPAGQLEILRRLKRFGKKVITLVCAGRPLVMTEVAELSDAVLYCWHGGVEAGNAIADVLTGREAPSGRLPVTLPRHSGQIPIYYNHKSDGRAIDEYYGDLEYPNYVDMPGSPLYPFGFGLSGTEFTYSDLRWERAGEDAVEIQAVVRNTGSRGGFETAQCYIRDDVASVTLPVRQLKGYRKLYLEPGEAETVRFRLNRESLSYYDRRGSLVFEPGSFTVWVGPNCQEGLQGCFTL